uniref:Uncharacterized protein n=1 Tax=Trichogramma kaykai TaxID=54128 RepID=A0ABD2VYI3_9HYME
MCVTKTHERNTKIEKKEEEAEELALDSNQPPLNLLPLPLLRVPPGIWCRINVLPISMSRDHDAIVESLPRSVERNYYNAPRDICRETINAFSRTSLVPYTHLAPGELRCLARLGESTLRLLLDIHTNGAIRL